MIMLDKKTVLCVFKLVGLCGIFLPWTVGQEITLSADTPIVNQIPASSTITTRIATGTLPASTKFIIVELHSHIHNLSLSYNASLSPGQYATGSDIGVVLGSVPGQPPVTSPLFLINSNQVPVDVLLLLHAYDENAPIPGGCNMEVSIKTAPFLPTFLSPSVLTVEYPLGAWPLNVNVVATCDRAPLQYDIYEFYLPERDLSNGTAFQSLQLMTGVGAIEKNGRKVEFNGVPASRVKFANYAGTGRIVAVVVRSLTSSAAYVPTLSYGCRPTSEKELDTCMVLVTIGSKVLSALLIFVGLFLTFFGHGFYKTGLFFLGFTATSVVSYLLLTGFVELLPSDAGMISTGVGAIGGALWLGLWARWGVPFIPLFLAATLLGILFASTVAYTPLADYAVLKTDATFWLAFATLVLVVPLALLSFGRLTSILWCSIVGSYIFLVPIDHYVGSNLKYIILNVLRRGTDGYFWNAIIDPPFQNTDIILTVVWALLALFGTAFQWWRERGRAPFPPAPTTWPSRRSSSSNRRPTMTTRTTDYNPTEATHLLS